MTGSDGLLGHALQSVSHDCDYSFHFATRADADLEVSKAADRLVKDSSPDCIIHAAALVGGIGYNMECSEELYKRNYAINKHLFDAALRYRVSKVISFLSTCIFPKDSPEPWDESIVHAGEPDERQLGYSKAKLMLDLMSRDYSQRSERRSLFLTLMPTTMYGPNDNYHPERSHVLPAIILKLHCVMRDGGVLTLWGTGSPRREFLFSRDLAHVALWAVEQYEDSETMIVSPSEDISISELAVLVADVMGHSGSIRWDNGKPDGTPSRRTDTAKFKTHLPRFEFTPLRDGIRVMVDHFRDNHPDIRGLLKSVAAGNVAC